MNEELEKDGLSDTVPLTETENAEDISDVTEPTPETEEVPEIAEENEIPTDEEDESATDYEELVMRDLEELKAEFPELSELTHVAELENPMRYAALRDLGLSAAEAYLASTRKRTVRDSRAHLSSATPRGAAIPAHSYMSPKELAKARELFSDMSDAEIQRLYRKVTA